MLTGRRCLEAHVVAARVAGVPERITSPPPDRCRTAAETSTSSSSAIHGECGTVGVDLGDLLAADEAEGVEVVDMEVGENSAGGSDVLRRRRDRVVRRGAHDQDPAVCCGR